MYTFPMTRYKVFFFCFFGAALLFLLYTFMIEWQKRTPHPIRPTRLPSIPSIDARVVTHPSSQLPSIDARQSTLIPRPLLPSPLPPMDARLPAFFREQAAGRKSYFERVLASSNPTLVDVMVFIAPEAYCPLLVRVGAVGDGGKWVCNPWALPKGGVVFSLGSRSDISFESDLQRATGQAAKIITVDRTAVKPEALAGLSSINAQFIQAEIAVVTDLKANPPHYTVADLINTWGLGSIELLKMDIEGSEYTVLPQFLNGNSVCQIMVEIHAFAETPKLLRAVANAGFLLLQYEVNPHGGDKGINEYTFIHESCMEKYGATLLASYLKE